MSEYTPTTEDIQRAYTSYTQPSMSDSGELFYGTPVEFDRWLIAERKRVAEMATHKEHERIINVLKETARELDMLQKDDEDEFSNGVIQGILGSIALLQDEDNG